MLRVRGQSTQTKHSYVCEVIEYNKDPAEKRKQARSVCDEIEKGAQKLNQIQYFNDSVYTTKPSCKKFFFLQFSTAVFLICVCFVSGQQYGEEFGKLTMMRKVPVMKDGSFVLTERYRDVLTSTDDLNHLNHL